MTDKRISRARARRKQPTVSEGLLWSILRARQLCGLKFRREHAISDFIADFACDAKKLIVEVDGGYHDQIGEQDISREKILRELGWDVLRFSDEDVEQDAESVGKAIAKHLRLEYSFEKRSVGGSGMKSGQTQTKRRLPNPNAPSTKRRSLGSTLPRDDEGV